MALNFPTSPAEGEVYAPGSGVHNYVSRDGVWTKRAGTATPYNRFVNPAFQISDLNGLTDGSNVSSLVMAEHFFMYFATNGVWRGQRVASPTPGGGKHRLRISMTTADPSLGSGEWLTLATGIEANRAADFGYGAATGKYGVVRFGVRAPAGTYLFNIRGANFTRSFLAPFQVLPAQANTDIIFTIVIPPDVTGSWVIDNTAWAWCYWVLDNFNTTSAATKTWMAGNYAGHSSMTNTFMATVGNTFELFDVGFYLDPNITGVAPPFVVPHIEEDHRECMRYWYKSYGTRGVTASATLAQRCGMTHPVPMRTLPSLTLYGSTLRAYDVSVAPNITAIADWSSNVQNIEHTITSSGFVAVGRPNGALVDTQTTQGIGVNARL